MVKKQPCDNRYCDETVEVPDDFKHEFCCSGRMEDMCGCGGWPINPAFCDKCEEKLFGKPIETQ